MTLKEQAESLLKDLNDCHEEKCEDCKYYAGECMSDLVDKAADLIQKMYSALYAYNRQEACPECGSTDYSEMYEAQTLLYYVGPPDQNSNKRTVTVVCNNCGKVYSFEKGYSNASENLDGRENYFLDRSIKQTDFLDRERMRL